MPPEPALICPFMGAANAEGESNASVTAISLGLNTDLQRPLVTTQVFSTWLQTRRQTLFMEAWHFMAHSLQKHYSLIKGGFLLIFVIC